jgi:hypothetical protein
MTSTRTRAEVLAVVRRPAAGVLLVLGTVLCAVDAAHPAGREPLGIAGSIVLPADGNLTYGLATALFTALVVTAGHDQLADLWHATGMRLAERLARCLAIAALIGICVRALCVVALAVGGAIDGARRGWQWGSTVPLNDVARGQGRVLVCYVLAAALGALIALAVRRTTTAVVVGLLMTVPYLPLVGSLTNRARPLLGVLPYGPFGALRGALTGNGAIFGDDPSHARVIAVATAVEVFICWTVVLSVAVMNRSAAAWQRRDGLLAAAPLVAALSLAGIAGGVLPQSLANTVPWQWRPAWRHAHAAGWDSRQVASRWAGLERSDRSAATAELFVHAATTAGVGDDTHEALHALTTFKVEPVSAMLYPTAVRLEVTYAPPLRSGNVAVDAAQFQLHFRYIQGRWLIEHVDGPFIHATVAP